MPKLRKSLLMEKCRICLCDNGVMTDIFTDELRGMIKELILSTRINIDENEKYPRNICHVCLYKLDMWCHFKAQFVQSNKVLLQQLKMELLNRAVSTTKRKLSESPLTPELNNDDLVDSKKIKQERPSTPPNLERNAMQFAISLEPSGNLIEPLLTPPGMLDSASESHSQQLPTPALKARISIGRRTSEQRLASTQRWEARKKALLAATGENDSDTDSMASDENQLSPIQKARAKNNAEKEAERQRRLVKACNNLSQGGALESSATDSYLQKSPENNIQMNLVDKTDDFVPKSVQSEIAIGDATYIVTSTLLLTEPFINKDHQTREKISEELPNYQNTDIMDAVKLKRVNPQSKAFQNDKKLIERCLNIEVEGTELPALQKVQAELAKFIEIEVKQKLMNNAAVEEKIEPKPQDSTHTLEQKLKSIIEKSLKNNIDNSRMKRVPISKITMGDRMNKTFSPSFIKAAMKSPHFQPKVLLSRVKLPKVEKHTEVTKGGGGGNHRNNTEFSIDNTQLLVTPSRKTYAVKGSRTPNILKSSRIDNTPSKKPDNLPREPGDFISNVDKHICGLCGATFPSQSQVEAHYEYHKSPNTVEIKHKMMRCKRCQEIVEAKFVKSHVCKTNKYKCEICNKVFNIQKGLEVHLKEHKNQEEQVKIERRSVEHTEVEPSGFVPPVFSIPASESIASVLTLDEENKGVSSCFICDKNFMNEELLRNHFQTHCDNTSEGDQVLEDKVYQCAICGETLESESGLEDHVEKHLCDDEDDNPNLINIEGILQVQINKQMHTCVQCAQQFDTELNLVMHMQQHEEEAAFAEWGKEGLKAQDDHACTICEETFTSEETLANHLDLHNGSCHICELCDRPFWTIDELQRHVISHCKMYCAA
ncbi:zinc finger and BTB domain-containing protein 41 [Diachasma alloeum]|uniref:zinc finger and BTB domain-containing protein 41 n=1 Tax=Diachasma alloeum TaxID=454923 RepID=UPI0007383CF8|nr:zinc finger and BTB domain-containing protein 41 [Diachasma alloeum]